MSLFLPGWSIRSHFRKVCMSIIHTNTFYLVRHGENPANITKEFSYKLVDYSLTPKGVLQAQQTAEFLRQTVKLTAAYASPLKRAYETGEIIARAQNLQVTIMEEFREINVGDMEQRPPTEANWREHDRIIGSWFQGHPEITFPGGENFLQLIERTQRGLLKIAREHNGQNILIASHGGILAALAYTFCPRDRSLITSIMDNCAVTQIEMQTGENEILDGSMSCWASSTHLSGEAAQLVSPVLDYKRS
jgi:broad specificity phosphatase PhoE